MIAAGAPFSEIALLLGISAAAGAVFVRLRQPPLIAYIIVGILVGPAGFGLVSAHDQIDLLAQFGIAVLLFVVGLKLDLHHVRHIGPTALATGIGQLFFTIVFGFGIVLALGATAMEALYVAVALTFSSTIIIVKLLSDKREIDSLHGRIAVGFLIVQDIAVVAAMLAMSALRETGDAGQISVALSLILRLTLAAALLYLAMRYVLPVLVATMARSQELLLVFAIAWGTGLAALGEWAGFSKEAGAFLAGFSLASVPYREAIGARLAAVRDFLLLFFFIELGARLDLSLLAEQILPGILLSLFVLIGNPLIVMAIMGYMGYRKRTAFLAGLTVAQISEFSIVFIAMGISLGHIGQEQLGLVTLVGLITITLSTYMILYSHPLYERLSPWLGLFERREPYRELAFEQQERGGSDPEIVIFGLGRYGGRLLSRLHEAGNRVLGVEFDPEVAWRLRRCGLPVQFGDAEDPEFIASLPLGSARWAITTLPLLDSNRALVMGLRAAAFRGRIAGVVRDQEHGAALAELGVDRVQNALHDAADHAAQTFGFETDAQQETAR